MMKRALAAGLAMLAMVDVNKTEKVDGRIRL